MKKLVMFLRDIPWDAQDGQREFAFAQEVLRDEGIEAKVKIHRDL